MKNKKIITIRVIIIILIILWMGMVFGFSSQNSDESSSLSLKVAKWFTDDTQMQHILEPYIRKTAHFLEYGLGGILFFSLFLTFKIKDKNKIIFSGLSGFVYAITDELHQLFVSGRSGKLADVCIDTLGVITGILCLKLVIKIYYKFTLHNKTATCKN